MKKKILILSLVANLIAGAFVLYSFTPKAKNVNEGGGGYLIMRVIETAQLSSDLSVSDGTNLIYHEDLNSTLKVDKMRTNNQAITKKINDFKSQGYEIISSNSGGGDLFRITNYVFVKK